MDRGTNSVVQLLSQILFQIFPAIANILIAVVLFTLTFSPAYGAIIFVTMALYLYVTITMTEWRTKFRRDMIELDNSARTKAVDSLLNFETVKYYGNSEYEVNRYRDAIVEYQKADWKSSASLNVLNLAQNSVISIGLFVGCLLFAYEVSLGRFTAGDFVIFNVYMMQLYSPVSQQQQQQQQQQQRLCNLPFLILLLS
jgi:ATP-binding cassette subfamily B (MDR/TAP) protein 6